MVTSLMPQEEEEADDRRLRVRFQAPPSPVLFSSDDQAVPLGEEECEEVRRRLAAQARARGGGGAGGEGVVPRQSGSEELSH